MNRVGRFFGMLLLVAVVFVLGSVKLWFGYWLSDEVYDAGLWPIGAVMRIYLFLFLIGWGFGLIALVFSALASPFMSQVVSPWLYGRAAALPAP